MKRHGLHCILFMVVAAALLISATGFKFNTGDKDNSKAKEVAKRIKTARDTLSAVANGLNGLAKMAKASYSILQKFQKVMGVLGPAAMAASIVLSVAMAFLPEPDSKELAFMKEKFDVVISGMLRIESKVEDLENTVVHEITKAGFGEYQRSIVGLYEDWKDVINSETPAEEAVSRGFFIKQYQNQYRHAAFQLFHSMTGFYAGELTNDLLSVAKTRYKCNGVKIRQLCNVVTRTIVQGITLEGAFYSYMELFRKANESEALWAARLKMLERKCEEKLEECRRDWKSYADPVMSHTYEQYKRSSNKELAYRLFTELSNTLPQRAWFVFVYQAVTGFRYHGYRVDEGFEENVYKRWRENDKMLTVVSFDMDMIPEFHNKREVKERLNYVQYLASACSFIFPNGVVEKEGALLHLRRVYVNEESTGMMTYAIKASLNSEFYGTEDRYLHLRVQLPPMCLKRDDYTFDLFAIG